MVGRDCALSVKSDQGDSSERSVCLNSWNPSPRTAGATLLEEQMFCRWRRVRLRWLSAGVPLLVPMFLLVVEWSLEGRLGPAAPGQETLWVGGWLV